MSVENNFSPKKLSLTIVNLNNKHESQIISDGVNHLDGVKNLKIDLNTKNISFEIEKEEDQAEVILDVFNKLKDLGFKIQTTKKNYPVLQLSCASCANSSQNVLRLQPGVISASVNYANEEATIEYIPSLISPEDFKKSLQEIGYDLLIDESEEGQEALEDIQKKNFHQLKFKTIASLLFSIPLVVIAMIPKLMHQPWANFAMWILATPVIFIFGRNFFIGAYKQAKHRSANMDTLVACSTGVAYIYSVFNTLFPHFWENKGLSAHVYFEASAVVISFVLLGKILEEKAKGNTSLAIKKLVGLQPKVVTVIYEDGKQAQLPIKSIQKGMKVLVKPGEKIAVDGKVISGSSFVNESMISGEPLAVEKIKDSNVYAGTLNEKGSFVYQAEKVGSETLLSQIIKSVKEAQGSKAPVQKVVDKIAGIFVPIVFGIAFFTFFIWLFFGGTHGFIYGLQCLVTVLVIACPCALGLATPTAIMVGIGKGAELGILIKDAESLEAAKNIDVVVLDKTGTITEGKPKVYDSKWFVPKDQYLVNLLYSMEKSSDHPLANSVVKNLETDSPKFISNIQLENIVGKGIQITYENINYCVGSLALMKEKQVLISNDVEEWMLEQFKQFRTVIFFGSESKILSAYSISDAIKPSSSKAIACLKQMGIEVVMLTGDNEHTAKEVSKSVGIEKYKAEVSPKDKIDYVKNLQSIQAHSGKNTVVAMIGDGINDSAALAQSDVSIAMGNGSDVAIEVAKMTIISGDLLKVPQAIKLSQRTVKTIQQNLFWAFIYNLIGIPIAAGILYPINGFLLNPMIAGAAMALSSLSVVGNSLLLKYRS